MIGKISQNLKVCSHYRLPNVKPKQEQDFTSIFLKQKKIKLLTNDLYVSFCIDSAYNTNTTQIFNAILQSNQMIIFCVAKWRQTKTYINSTFLHWPREAVKDWTQTMPTIFHLSFLFTFFVHQAWKGGRAVPTIQKVKI